MSWKTEITLRNNRDEDMLCLIPQGLVFENKTVGSMIQNVASSRDYKLIVPGSSRLTVEIDVDCINRSFSSPAGRPGNVTIFKIDQSFSSQQDLWDIMSKPLA
jgi:hypothetical protein